ncbi:MAG: tyrosine-type recombinase/integrase [Pyrinomonadaceae bacterium MAG19_C2-C3]|nr:tyrosine-type recombinase/integrase [Pyrinomonadaceae bacterium MAG19_C2-C3]
MAKKQITRYGVWQEETARFGKCWCYRIRVADSDGVLKRKAASGFATKAEADAAVARLTLDTRARKHGIEVSKPLKSPTVGEATDAYIRQKEAQWESDYGADYLHRNKAQLNPIRDWADQAGRDRLLTTITRDDLTAYVLSETKRSVSKSSIARRINSIIAAINHARDTNVDALAGYRSPKRPLGKDVSAGRMRILTPEEIKLLTTALAANPANRDVLDFFLIALGAGGRFDEIVSTVVRKQQTSGIMWNRIHIKAGTIDLYAYKTKKWRTILVPAVVELLMKRKAEGLGSATHAFAIRDHNIRKTLETISTECGIPYGRKVEGGWSPHDLRHTCLSFLLHSGVDIATVRDFAGHASITETSRYVHATDSSRLLAAQASASLINRAMDLSD